MDKLYGWAHERFPAPWTAGPTLRRGGGCERPGFQVADAALRSTWGLPVEILLAQKPR